MSRQYIYTCYNREARGPGIFSTPRLGYNWRSGLAGLNSSTGGTATVRHSYGTTKRTAQPNVSFVEFEFEFEFDID